MRQVLVIIFLLFLGSHSWATGQIPDKILYGGKSYELNSNPLEPYFEKNSEKKPKSSIQSTALWRGYVATFEIKDSQLVVKDIEIEVENYDSTMRLYQTRWVSVFDQVFPGRSEVAIDWWSGLLVLPYGKMVQYVHMGYGSTYENYILLAIEKGHFKTERRFDDKTYVKFRARQYEAFKKTPEYQNLVDKLTKEGSSQAFIDSFLKVYIVSYTSKFLTD
jgi:hypothetical protein